MRIAYRYIDVLHSTGDDEYGYSTYTSVYLEEYDIIKETPKGMWVAYHFGGRKHFVHLGARKKFACLSKEDAIISFRARKERQVRILESQLKHAKMALEKANRLAPVK